MTWLDASRVAERLSSRSGLHLVGEIVKENGGTFPCVRPSAPERPAGFSILLSRSPRAVQASFEPDRFARPLVSQIQDTFDTSPSALEDIVRGLVADEGRLVVAIDGVRVAEGVPLPGHEWTSFSVECDMPLHRVTRDGEQVLDAAVEAAGKVLAVVLAGLVVEPVEEIESADGLGLPEGAAVRVVVNRYERSAANRMACIAHYGMTCQACGISFANVYGSLGEDFIHVHHRTPVSELGPGYVVNPVEDLIPVCPNCHAMLHRKKPPMDVAELREVIARRSSGEPRRPM